MRLTISPYLGVDQRNIDDVDVMAFAALGPHVIDVVEDSLERLVILYPAFLPRTSHDAGRPDAGHPKELLHLSNVDHLVEDGLLALRHET